MEEVASTAAVTTEVGAEVIIGTLGLLKKIHQKKTVLEEVKIIEGFKEEEAMIEGVAEALTVIQLWLILDRVTHWSQDGEEGEPEKPGSSVSRTSRATKSAVSNKLSRYAP